ncbi:acetolactate synthase catalytic subunit [Chryseobacterium piperi]|uniref:Acetolactate synthase n=1 Tax=Chryseobacterium piperi TaxID=558152 RepID=A0A086BJW3_9FLAO|nr:biosynthetic-type acetolactate synthase large subunit [Chryseobacterium piperi]ASW73782.1 acetolactate synthase, large subunit, biosynthetic type [Chryseobacterium piperi]KFF29227.1 acetolactate synthase catalytic subunit [Chryseobacterium piperi]
MDAALKTLKENKSPGNGRILKGAEVILEILKAENVTTVFGYPGGAVIPIYDALYDYKEDIQHILVRHEQGAIHAAQGVSRSSGHIGVAIATSGPGATNLVTGLADAMIDSTPLVCITGQVYASLLGSDAFQEVDVINVTAPVTKWNCQVTDAKDLPNALAKAFYIAKSGRPGPVLVDITKNAQLQEIEFDEYETCSFIRSYYPKPNIRKEYIEQAASLINAAQRPFLLFGQGVIIGKAEQELKDLVEKTGIPAASTALGLGALSTEHPLYVGMLGMHGHYAPNKLTNDCDVLIAVGMRFDDRVTGKLDQYARQAKIVHLDIDLAEIDKNVKADVPVLGNCKETLPLLADLLDENTHDEWLNQFKTLRNEENEVVVARELNPTTEELTMGEVLKYLNELTDGEYIICTDVGQHQMISCRYAEFKESKRNVTSGGLGTMGFGLPSAIGAKMVNPDKHVICIAGDGGFQMNIQELGTIAQFGIGVKMIVLNNSFLGMVRQWQELFHDKRYSFVDITSPDFATVAGAYGIKGKHVKERNLLKSSLEEMLTTEGAYLLEIKVGKENNVFPMVPQGCCVSEIRLK